MKRLLSALLFSNAWVAFCFSILCLGLAHSYNLENTLVIWGFSFFGTVVSYTVHRELRMIQLKNEQIVSPRFLWMKDNRKALRCYTIICFCLGSWSFFELNWNTTLFYTIACIAFITGLYTFRLPVLNGGLRGIPGTKILWISATWTLTALVPLISNQVTVPLIVPVLVFATTFIQVIPFDVRDLVNDKPGLKTIPQLIGRERSQILVAISSVLIALAFNEHVGFSWWMIPFVFSSFCGVFCKISDKNTLFLEFLWEIPLLFLGLMWYSIPN